MAIAERHGLFVLEDAAQGVAARYDGRPLGSIGHLGAVSFHETKNLIAGEGGALLINDERFVDRAHVLREKGTNRTKFLQGRVDKYTWVDVGSSYLPSELNAAFLLAQFEKVEEIQRARHRAWDRYHRALAPLAREGLLAQPAVPQICAHNAHIYYVLMPTVEKRAGAAAAHQGGRHRRGVPLRAPAQRARGRSASPASTAPCPSPRTSARGWCACRSGRGWTTRPSTPCRPSSPRWPRRGPPSIRLTAGPPSLEAPSRPWWRNW